MATVLPNITMLMLWSLLPTAYCSVKARRLSAWLILLIIDSLVATKYSKKVSKEKKQRNEMKKKIKRRRRNEGKKIIIKTKEIREKKIQKYGTHLFLIASSGEIWQKKWSLDLVLGILTRIANAEGCPFKLNNCWMVNDAPSIRPTIISSMCIR